MEQDYLDPRSWKNFTELSPKRIECGFCGENSISHFGYEHSHCGDGGIYICPNCGCPSFFDYHYEQHPGPRLGREIDNLPEDVEGVYDEIRECIKNNANTAAILLGRKLLMHLSVNKAGADANLPFAAHVKHLKESGFVPPNGDRLVEFIREIGNQQNHEIVIGDYDVAEKMLKFIEMLLLFMYEMTGYIDDIDEGIKTG